MISTATCRPAWVRPLDKVPYPNVWLEFEAKESKTSDKIVKYRIQDLPEDRFDEAIQHLNENFIADEPISRFFNGRLNEAYCKDLERLWRTSMEQKTTLVCFREGSDEIVGMNMMLFCLKDDPYMQQIEKLSESVGFRSICKIIDICYERFSPYEKYNVDRYISSMGLTVLRKYRGIALGTRMLEARRHLAAPFGFKISETLFTSDFSNVNADNAGFQLDIELTFDELNEINPEFGFKDVPSSRVALKTLVL